MMFVQIAEGIDDATWQHHLRAGDYSEWFRDKIKDDELADEAAAIEADDVPRMRPPEPRRKSPKPCAAATPRRRIEASGDCPGKEGLEDTAGGDQTRRRIWPAASSPQTRDRNPPVRACGALQRPQRDPTIRASLPGRPTLNGARPSTRADMARPLPRPATTRARDRSDKASRPH